MIEACSNCKFFMESGQWVTVCRRYPEFIQRKPTDWCGEYIKQIVVEAEQPIAQLAKPKGRPRKNV